MIKGMEVQANFLPTELCTACHAQPVQSKFSRIHLGMALEFHLGCSQPHDRLSWAVLPMPLCNWWWHTSH